MNIDKIPDYILGDIRARGNTDDEIRRMDAETVFNEYCNWHGLINWGRNLWSVAERLRSAESKVKP